MKLYLKLAQLAGIAALAICAGCKTPPAETAKAPDRRAAPPLAIESFQKVWEIVRDSHFDTNFNGLDWNEVRGRFLPRVEAAQSQDEVRDVLQEMIGLLGHSHLMIIPGETKAQPAEARPQDGNVRIEIRPAEDRIAVLRVEEGSSAAKQGLQPGAVIVSIDGEAPMDPMVNEFDPNVRHREFLNWHHAVDLLRGPVGENCVLVIDDGAGRRTISIPRERETGEPAQLGNLPVMFTRISTRQLTTEKGKRAGYVRFNLWMLPAVAVFNRFVDENRNADGIVVDMRGNLGGIGGMVVGVAGHFINERASLGKMKMRDNELTFTAFPRRVDLQLRPTNTFQGKLAILTDAISLSSAELFAGGMQELGRARVFGQTTGGQALPAMSDRLPNGDLFYHAVADFTTPKGRRLETNGVEPDEKVALRIEALRAGRDEPLEAALRWMDQ